MAALPPLRVLLPDTHLPPLALLSASGEESLDQCYRFCIEVASAQPLGRLHDLRGERLSLILAMSHANGAMVERRFHGRLLSAELLTAAPGRCHYRLQLQQELALLAQQRRSRALLCESNESEGVDQGFTTPEMLAGVLAEHGLGGDHLDMSQLQADYAQRDYVVQYEESDLDFVERWLQREGICRRVHADIRGEQLILMDDSSAYGSIDPRLGSLAPASGGGAADESYAEARLQACRVWELRHTHAPAPLSVTVRDHNWRRPGLTLEQDWQQDGGTGARLYHDQHAKTPDEAQHLARCRGEEAWVHAEQLSLRSNCPALAAGLRFPCQLRPRTGGAIWVVLRVHHRWHQQQDADGRWQCRYDNQVWAIPGDRCYRPQPRVAWPQMSGCLSAHIHAADADALQQQRRAALDADGRYRVRIPFLRAADAASGQAPSRWLRMLQFSPGDGGGFHFTLGAGSEVALLHQGGDPDRPLIAGSLCDRAHPSLLSAAQRDHTRLRTAAGHQLQWGEADGQESFALISAGAGGSWRLGAGNPLGDGASAQFAAAPTAPTAPAPMAASSAEHASDVRSQNLNDAQRRQDMASGLASLPLNKPRWAQSDQPRQARHPTEVAMGNLLLRPYLRGNRLLETLSRVQTAMGQLQRKVGDLPRHKQRQQADQVVAQLRGAQAEQAQAHGASFDDALAAVEEALAPLLSGLAALQAQVQQLHAADVAESEQEALISQAREDLDHLITGSLADFLDPILATARQAQEQLESFIQDELPTSLFGGGFRTQAAQWLLGVQEFPELFDRVDGRQQHLEASLRACDAELAALLGQGDREELERECHRLYNAVASFPRDANGTYFGTEPNEAIDGIGVRTTTIVGVIGSAAQRGVGALDTARKQQGYLAGSQNLDALFAGLDSGSRQVDSTTFPNWTFHQGEEFTTLGPDLRIHYGDAYRQQWGDRNIWLQGDSYSAMQHGTSYGVYGTDSVAFGSCANYDFANTRTSYSASGDGRAMEITHLLSLEFHGYLFDLETTGGGSEVTYDTIIGRFESKLVGLELNLRTAPTLDIDAIGATSAFHTGFHIAFYILKVQIDIVFFSKYVSLAEDLLKGTTLAVVRQRKAVLEGKSGAQGTEGKTAASRMQQLTSENVASAAEITQHKCRLFKVASIKWK